MTKYFGAKSLVFIGALFLVGTLHISPVLAQEPVPEKEDGTDLEFMQIQKKYIEDYAEKDGFIIRPGGMLVKRLRAGTGKSPAKTDVVVVNYSGMLADGIVFDSSYARNRPETFEVGGVIKGWTQALLLMREGSKWEIIIPSTLGYGVTGSPPVIPPYAVLHFTVELVAIQGQK